MLWYIGRRLLQMIPVFLGATLIVYLMAFYTSGDPILALAGDKPISPAVEQQLREQYNLDQPVLVQWLLYLKSVLTFDLGVGFNGRPIWTRSPPPSRPPSDSRSSPSSSRPSSV